ncbi:hypothetical protein CMO91_03145 [Candidatus Woesearchaeota archaeon]|nr:hypothetical protein [Candidatus Woesearchaeota archaeon]|tara:strand:+ start:527 stop:1348 length:822 start_codon:yes stop_codon:yes gene_type:complete
MRWIIVSDLHANKYALDVVAENIKESKGEEDKIVCLGDVVGYGVHGNECIQWVNDTADVFVPGNHDYGTLHLFNQPSVTLDSTHANWTGRWGMMHAWKDLDDANVEILKELSGRTPIFTNGVVVFSHGAPVSATKMKYVENEGDAKEYFFRNELRAEHYCLVGHTHIPQVYIEADEGIKPKDLAGKAFLSQLGDCKALGVVPSVGQSRDGSPFTGYAILEYVVNEDPFAIEGSLEIVRLPYDVGAMQEDMRKADAPDELIARLENADPPQRDE